jgi:hypothetical protein
MSSIRKDLPSVNAPNFNERLRETLQTYLGHRGHPLDRGVILRDLVESNIIKLRAGFLATGSGNPIAGPGGALGGNAAYEPDLTPPPTPTGFTAGAGISYLFIGCAPQTYSQGHGHLVTRLYGATWTTGDLPVFADATVLTEFQGTVFAHPTNPATTWHLWITWVTRDGVESPTPAGGTNGLVVTSGQDVSSLLDALTGQITQSQLYADLATPIASIAGLTDATSQNAAAIVQEGVDRAAAVAAEAQARATAITQEQQARATAVQAESQARTNEILAVQAELLADLESADAAVKTLLRSEFASADAATLASAQSYSYSKAQTDGAIAAQGTELTASFTAADAATLASAQNFTYSKSTIDAATAATLATLRSEFAAADTSTLASAKSYAYSKAQADSAIATSADTLRAQITGGSTGTDLNALTSGLLYQERIARVSATDSLAQQLTLLSAGAGEQFDYKSIWYFDSGIEGWSANLTTSTAVTAVDGWLRMTATTGTQTGRMFQSPAALGIEGAKYPQVRLRVRKVGAPTWVGRLYFTTTADSTWNTAKSLLEDEPTYDANNIGLLTFNMPAGWTGATIAQIQFEASTDITAANYFELDWAAIGRPSPGASSAQLSALELATAAADAAEAAERTALAAEVAGKASGEALSALETRVSTAEGVNTSQGASITSLNNSLTTLTGTVNDKADATALNALTTRVTAAEGVNTSQGSSITTLNNNVSTLTTGLDTKADASAVTALDTRVTAAEGVNSTQSSNITTLTNSLNTLTSTVNTKASASALSDLTSRVTAAEGVNTSQGDTLTSQSGSITSLSNSLSVTNGNVTAAQTTANAAASALSALASTVTSQGNTLTAQATAITTLQSQVATGADDTTALSAALSTEASTRATQTGELYAKYTVKVDVAGLISGYGLASTANNAAPTSSFGVRANAFFVSPPAVASATAPSANLYDGFVWLDTSVIPNVTRYRSGSSWVLNAPVLPFVVQATPTTVNGVAVPAGVYANDLFVKNGTITNAKIANLAVDDAKIANLSVSKLDAGSLKVGSYISSSNYVSGSQGFAVWATGAAEFNNVTVRGAVYANTGVFSGTVYASSGSFTGTVNATSGTFSGAVYASSGSFTGNIYSNTGTIGGVKINGNGLNGGSFIGYAWPTDGGGGFHLGPNGLLLGNANLGRYLQIEANGNIHTPGFNVINGTMTVHQANVINTLNVAGNAVTSSVASFGGTVSFNGLGAYTPVELCSLGFSSTGAPALLFAGVHSLMGMANVTAMSVIVRTVVDGWDVRSTTQVLVNSESYGDGAGLSAFGGSLAIPPILITGLSAGWHTVSLQIYATSALGYYNNSASGGALVILETKR